MGQLKAMLAPSAKSSKGLTNTQHTYEVRMLARDAYTSKNVLMGGKSNQAFGRSLNNHTCELHKNECYKPLDAFKQLSEEKELGAQDVLILSVGGNDVRELLNQGNAGIKNFLMVLQHLFENYNKILNKIRDINPNINIVIQTQYPVDKNYPVYAFFKDNFKKIKPINVLHAVIKVWLDAVLQNAYDKGVRHIIDLTSSLEHTNKELYINSIELSQKGSEIAAKLQFEVIKAILGHASNDLDATDDEKYKASVNDITNYWLNTNEELKKTPSKSNNNITWSPSGLSQNDENQVNQVAAMISDYIKIMQGKIKQAQSWQTTCKWLAVICCVLAVAAFLISWLAFDLACLYITAKQFIQQSGSFLHSIG